mmetsp:Transcript_5663/g.8216  ORF Transcript_5663/g.8216 Transcript_5663/m.8216 type:complete len:188 (+) Transcript_5663:88-651(+)|eukprot:CAMPEP_0184856586 /NCGR_PEP_ID=MMETSP0580-20130426/1770_1 /TAXON_ID=1118495 /ORGANISM="Dactyliosolen fragilissimus" /LENGTH=187 /DNA_ID=CAMNT_0027351689 /DNA_START=91 /DNA_END=654 /DNA_ORIENTATION=+
MNDTTLPKIKTTVERKKVGVKRGFALHDWTRLLRSSRDLAQRNGAPLRNITPDEIAQHSSVHDAWISLHGKVYNISPYLPYHPGGVDIMKSCFGGDASKLFDKYHRWVNVHGLIGPLLLGYLQESPQRSDENDFDYHKSNLPTTTLTTFKESNQMTVDGFTLPVPRPRSKTKLKPLLPNNDEEDADD